MRYLSLYVNDTASTLLRWRTSFAYTASVSKSHIITSAFSHTNRETYTDLETLSKWRSSLGVHNNIIYRQTHSLSHLCLINLLLVFSERELKFTFAICYRPSVCLSVCLSSVTFVRPTQAVQIFGNISTALGTLAIH